jgi:tripeptidyl-peptidase-1
VISLLNDFLISKGKSPLGFLNPLIYSAGGMGFNDITSGSNPGCGTSGFSATKGWDPVSKKIQFNPLPICGGTYGPDVQVTGLGTPDFQKLQKLCYKD